MMNWHETIEFIRTKKEFKNLVLKAYLHEDIVANVENFEKSISINKSLRLLKKYKKPQGRNGGLIPIIPHSVSIDVDNLKFTISNNKYNILKALKAIEETPESVLNIEIN